MPVRQPLSWIRRREAHEVTGLGWADRRRAHRVSFPIPPWRAQQSGTTTGQCKPAASQNTFSKNEASSTCFHLQSPGFERRRQEAGNLSSVD